MPNRTKKNPNRSIHSEGSYWQNFHFSGKLIVCSVIFGLMLILIGGIVMAIGMDQDDDIKSDDYEDLQKKPPMAIVGPVIMGIGGFTVIVGVFMCLVETHVCRRNNVENRSLIEQEDMIRDSVATGLEYEPTAVPSTSHRHQNGNAKKHPSPRKTRSGKKTYSTKDRSNGATSPGTPATLPISVIGNGSKQFLIASDKFLTPPSSFTDNMHQNSRDAENQTGSSMMKSFTSSGNSGTVSTDFHTPNASSVENSMSLEASPNERSNKTLDSTSLIINYNEFLTPKNSVGPDMLISSMQNPINHKKFFSNAEVPNGAGVSECSHSATSDQIEIEKKHMNSDILVEASIQMNSDIIDETSITPELEDTNLNTEYRSSSSPLEGNGETLSIGESGGGNKSHTEIAEVTLNSDKTTKNKKKEIENNLNIPMNLPTENKEITFNSANTVSNQENNGTDNKNICVDEDKSKSFDIEDKETISKDLERKGLETKVKKITLNSANTVLNQENNGTGDINICVGEDKSKSFDIEDKKTQSKDLERKGLETEVEYSRNESDTINSTNVTEDISLQENVCNEIEQKPIDCKSTDNNTNSTS